MASIVSSPMLGSLSVHCVHSPNSGRSVKVHVSNTSPAVSLSNRRQLLLFLTATTAFTVTERKSNAADIPLFGLRKKLTSAEEGAVEIVKEGFETAERGLEAAEKGFETAERGLEAAEKGLKTAEAKVESAEKEIEESAVSFGALAQAGTVAGAEFLGVVVATSVVNGILAAEAPKS